MFTKLSYSLLLFVAIAYVCYVNAEEEKKVCTPGNSYFDGCNTCYCLLFLANMSNSIICTNNICPYGYEKVPPPEDFWKGSLELIN